MASLHSSADAPQLIDFLSSVKQVAVGTRLSCKGDGNPKPVVQIFCCGSYAGQNCRYRKEMASGPETASFLVPGSLVGTNQKFCCSVSNADGKVDASATVKIIGKSIDIAQ